MKDLSEQDLKVNIPLVAARKSGDKDKVQINDRLEIGGEKIVVMAGDRKSVV